MWDTRVTRWTTEHTSVFTDVTVGYTVEEKTKQTFFS